MKTNTKKIISGMVCLLLILSAVGCTAGKSKAEKNSEAFLHLLYDCPNEDLIEDIQNNLITEGDQKLIEMLEINQKLSEKFKPYTAESYLENFMLKMQPAIDQERCVASGGTSKIKTITVDEVKKGQVEASLTLDCVDKNGETATINFSILMNTDDDGKVSFFRLPTNHNDYVNLFMEPYMP